MTIKEAKNFYNKVKNSQKPFIYNNVLDIFIASGSKEPIHSNYFYSLINIDALFHRTKEYCYILTRETHLFIYIVDKLTQLNEKIKIHIIVMADKEIIALNKLPKNIQIKYMNIKDNLNVDNYIFSEKDAYIETMTKGITEETDINQIKAEAYYNNKTKCKELKKDFEKIWNKI